MCTTVQCTSTTHSSVLQLPLSCLLLFLFFFFSSRRRHTRCSRDWSSDVCSSDLGHGGRSRAGRRGAGVVARCALRGASRDRKRVGEGKRVDFGGRRIIKKKKKKKKRVTRESKVKRERESSVSISVTWRWRTSVVG